MNLKTIALLSALLFTPLIKAQDLTAFLATTSDATVDTTETTNDRKYNLILDPSLSFGPMAFVLFEGAAGLEWYTMEAPEQRWNVKANYGQGDIWIIPVQDSGDWNGSASVFYLEANYAKDFYSWSGRNFDEAAGYVPNSFFVEMGVLGGFGRQNIDVMHTWTVDQTIDERRYGIFTGLRLGLGYRHTFPDRTSLSFMPFSVAAGYMHMRTSWAPAKRPSDFEVLNVNLYDFQIQIPLD